MHRQCRVEQMIGLRTLPRFDQSGGVAPDQRGIIKLICSGRREQIDSRATGLQCDLRPQPGSIRIIRISPHDRRISRFHILRRAVRQRLLQDRVQAAAALQCWSMNA